MERTPLPIRPRPSAFLIGWCKLPHELRLEVLYHVVPFGESFRNNVTSNLFLSNSTNPSQTRIRALFFSRHVSGLALEVFYIRSIARIGHPVSGRWLPPSKAREHIRRLEVHIDMNTAGLDRLAKLGHCSPEFLNLRHVEITIRARLKGHLALTLFRAAFATTLPIRISTRNLEIYFHHPRPYACFRRLPSHKADFNAEVSFLEKFSIVNVGSEGTGNERWEKYYDLGHWSHEKLLFIDAPAWPRNPIDIAKVTKKIMWR